MRQGKSRHVKLGFAEGFEMQVHTFTSSDCSYRLSGLRYINISSCRSVFWQWQKVSELGISGTYSHLFLTLKLLSELIAHC